MKLYHGSNVKVENINLSMSRPAKDFGRAFYLECMERDLATLLVEKRGMTIRQALSILYDSDTYRLLQNPNTGLYFQSPKYVYSYLQEEIEQGKIGNVEC